MKPVRFLSLHLKSILPKFEKNHRYPVSNPYESSGLIQVFKRDMIALYDEQL